MILFCTAFILQFVGHRIGDYLFQTDWQANHKAKDWFARYRHCVVYSLTICLMMLLAFDWNLCFWIGIITLVEHFIVDARWPVVGWKNFMEKNFARRKDFDISTLPFFVIIEIDQTIHIVRIFLISLLIAHGIL